MRQRQISVYRERQKSIRKKFEFKKWKAATYLLLTDYCHLLRKWKEEYEPKDFEELLHPLLVESLQELVKMEYYCDLFLYGTDADIKESKEYEERLVKRIADRANSMKE